jgi:hypothetical protein
MIAMIVFGCLLAGLSFPLWALDEASMVSCRAEGQRWLCTERRDGKLEHYYSETYSSRLDYRDQSPPPRVGGDRLSQLLYGEPEPEFKKSLGKKVYTLQLMACSHMACRQGISRLARIPASRTVDIKNRGKLWQVLLVGEFVTRKAALKAAGELILKYHLREKPWVRTLESIQRREVKG